MMSSTWRIEEPPSGAPTNVGPQLVTFRFLLDALRRRWRTWVGCGLAGMLLGAAYVLLVPATSVGTVTLLLAHETGADPAVAMATDVSLLRTRTVAETVTSDLGLDMSPEAFQQSVVPTPSTSQILILDVRAPDDAAATKRASVLAETFLDFRAAQLRSRSNALISGYQNQVDGLKGDQKALDAEYEQLTSLGATGQDRAAGVLTRRSQINAQISDLQQRIEDAKLQVDAQVEASHVLDPATPVERSTIKRAILGVGSGMVGGLAVGIGLVLFTALTSDRLRRRDEVALALGVPVRASTGRLRPRRRLPFTHPHDEADVAALTHALESALPPENGKGPQRLMVAAVDDIEDGELVTAALAAELTARGRTVLLVDLGQNGGLAAELTRALDHADPGVAAVPSLLRPDGPPHLATGPYGIPAGTTALLTDDDPRRLAWEQADVVLVLTDIQPGDDVDLLRTWAKDVVLLVTAGGSSAERLTTSAELLRSAGLNLPFALMVASEATDESLGTPEAPRTGESGTDRKMAQ
jgi:capsular polysaccharide biosynthesis protein